MVRGEIHTSSFEYEYIKAFGTKFAGDIRGVSGEGFTEEKLTAMRAAMDVIMTTDIMSQPTMINGMLLSPYRRSRDRFKWLGKVSKDGSKRFRGITLADFIMLTVVGEGKIVGGFENKESTGALFTSSFREAANCYANQALDRTSSEQDSVRVRFRKFLESLGYSRAEMELVGPIVFSPVVLRVDESKYQQARRMGKVYSTPKNMYQYIEPYLPFDCLSSAFLDYTQRWSKIDFRKLLEMSTLPKN